MSQLQEIFDFVAIHLLAQGKRSLAPGNRDYACTYRGRDGTACAVGCLITDEAYSPTLEGLLVHEDGADGILCDALKKSGIVVNAKSLELLTQLQDIHDWEDVDVWPEALMGAAIRHGLNMDVLGGKP